MDVSWVNVRFVIRPYVIVGLQCKVCVLFCINPSIPFFTRDWFKHSWLATDDSTHILFKSIKEDSSRHFTSVYASLQCTMDQIDAFPEHISTTVVPVTLPEKPDALEYAARQGQVHACIIYQEPNMKRVFVLF
ncbi:uncharacterized protein TNCV_360921 [Trichonephila clavipes]|nr:uncharacterized protein TNCV_360921 [Trichonephila clavipes]